MEQHNGAADAEAICEAAPRPTMWFVATKSEEVQAAAIVFRTRDLLVRRRSKSVMNRSNPTVANVDYRSDLRRPRDRLPRQAMSRTGCFAGG